MHWRPRAFSEEKSLRFRFKSKKLEALYTQEKGVKKFPAEVVDAFFDLMAVIDSAPNIQDFQRLRGLNFERLRGDREGQWSMRLNKQWRLVVELETDSSGQLLLIVEIVDYH